MCVQEELASTKTDMIMYRQIMHDLIQLVASGSKRKLYLDGPTGNLFRANCRWAPCCCVTDV